MISDRKNRQTSYLDTYFLIYRGNNSLESSFHVDGSIHRQGEREKEIETKPFLGFRLEWSRTEPNPGFNLFSRLCTIPLLFDDWVFSSVDCTNIHYILSMAGDSVVLKHTFFAPELKTVDSI